MPSESHESEPQVIPADQARDLLQQAIVTHLGDDWDQGESAWHVITSHAYMARLNRGRYNVDFYVNYFNGHVDVKMREIHSGQDSGWLFSWIIVLVTAIIVLLLADSFGLI